MCSASSRTLNYIPMTTGPSTVHECIFVTCICVPWWPEGRRLQPFLAPMLLELTSVKEASANGITKCGHCHGLRLTRCCTNTQRHQHIHTRLLIQSSLTPKTSHPPFSRPCRPANSRVAATTHIFKHTPYFAPELYKPRHFTASSLEQHPHDPIPKFQPLSIQLSR